MKTSSSLATRMARWAALAALVTGCATVSPTATSAPTQAPAEATPAASAVTEAPAATAEPAAPTTAPEATAAEVGVVPATLTKLNLNEASGDDFLNAIPGFSNRMVREFLEYRPYISLQQFRREIGKYVDDAQVAAYEQYVYVPVDINAADAETLKQIPGVDDALAADLIAGRPYDSQAAFLARLGAQAGADVLPVAAAYLSE